MMHDCTKNDKRQINSFLTVNFDIINFEIINFEIINFAPVPEADGGGELPEVHPRPPVDLFAGVVCELVEDLLITHNFRHTGVVSLSSDSQLAGCAL